MTIDAAGSFYVSASLDSLDPLSHASEFAVLKYNFNGKLQGAFRHENALENFGVWRMPLKLTSKAISTSLVIPQSVDWSFSFTSAGVQSCADRFGDSAGNPVALAIDQSGNIYAAGNGAMAGATGSDPSWNGTSSNIRPAGKYSGSNIISAIWPRQLGCRHTTGFREKPTRIGHH